MEQALLLVIAIVLGGGVAGGLLTTWSLHRRTRKLEWAVADLEARSVTVANREKSVKRWQKQETLDNELEALMASAKNPSPSRRTRQFSNDPMEPEV